MDWTPEMDAELVRLIQEKHLPFSAAAVQVSKAFVLPGEGVSRNAAVGRYKRLRDTGRAPPVPVKRNDPRLKKEKRIQKKVSVAPVGKSAKAEPKPPPPILLTKPTVARKPRKSHTLILDTTGCRWPVSQDEKGRHLFCNQPVELGHSYCDCHAELAFDRRTKPSQSKQVAA